MWNMKVTIILIVIGALGTITKGLIQEPEDLEIRGRLETIQTTKTSSGDMKKLAPTSDPSERFIANADVKNADGVTLIVIKNPKKKIEGRNITTKIRKKSERFEERKFTDICVYWNRDERKHRKEYPRRTRKRLETKQYSRTLIKKA